MGHEGTMGFISFAVGVYAGTHLNQKKQIRKKLRNIYIQILIYSVTMGFISFAVGVYAGTLLNQNYRVPKVASPCECVQKVKDMAESRRLEESEKSRRHPGWQWGSGRHEERCHDNHKCSCLNHQQTNVGHDTGVHSNTATVPQGNQSHADQLTQSPLVWDKDLVLKFQKFLELEKVNATF